MGVIVCSRDQPKLIFVNSAETGPKVCNVVSTKNETEAEFIILFRPKLKPKLKVGNAECIMYMSRPKSTCTENLVEVWLCGY